MKTTDFSTPRHMSKSAYVIFFIQYFKSTFHYFFIFFIINLFRNQEGKSALQIFLILLMVSLGCVVLAAVTALVKFYFQQFHVESGNLIFQHGVWQRATVSLPLEKIQTLRTKQGVLYRLLDMKGIEVDTLASKDTEIEIILDNDDWEKLFGQIQSPSSSPAESVPTEENTLTPKETVLSEQRLQSSNLNILKGALCQNHLHGMTILLGSLGILFNELSSYSYKAVNWVAESIEQYANECLVSLWTLLLTGAVLYTLIFLFWMGKIFLQYFNLEIRIHEGQLYCESGLLARYSSQFSYDKVCTVYIKRNILEKTLHCSTVILRQAFNATDEKKGADVKIYGSNLSESLLNWWLGKNYQTSPVITTSHSGWGLFSFSSIPHLALTLAASSLLFYYHKPQWLFVTAMYLLIILLRSWFRMRHSYLTLHEDYVLIGSGFFAKEHHYVKYNQIEVVRLKASPFTPLWHRVSLTLATNGTCFTIRSLPEREARNLYEYLLEKQQLLSCSLLQ